MQTQPISMEADLKELKETEKVDESILLPDEPLVVAHEPAEAIEGSAETREVAKSFSSSSSSEVGSDSDVESITSSSSNGSSASSKSSKSSKSSTSKKSNPIKGDLHKLTSQTSVKKASPRTATPGDKLNSLLSPPEKSNPPAALQVGESFLCSLYFLNVPLLFFL
jgi:hypothetical protein